MYTGSVPYNVRVVLKMQCSAIGMAQLCANERMCEVSINATQSFQQYQLNDGVKICFSCLFNGIIETDTTWFIDDSPDIPLTTGANPFGTNNNGVLEICNTTDILDRVADATPRFVCQSLNASASHSLFITLRGKYESLRIEDVKMNNLYLICTCTYAVYMYTSKFTPFLSPSLCSAKPSQYHSIG